MSNPNVTSTLPQVWASESKHRQHTVANRKVPNTVDEKAIEQYWYSLDTNTQRAIMAYTHFAHMSQRQAPNLVRDGFWRTMVHYLKPVGAAGLLFLPFFLQMLSGFDSIDITKLEKSIKKNVPKKVIKSLGLEKATKFLEGPGKTLEKIVDHQETDEHSNYAPQEKSLARTGPREINSQVEDTAEDFSDMLDHSHMYNEDGLDVGESEDLETRSIDTDQGTTAITNSTTTSIQASSQLLQEATALKAYYQSARDDSSPQNIQQVKYAINETFDDIDSQLQVIQNEINISNSLAGDDNQLENMFKDCQESLTQFIQIYQLIKQTYNESDFNDTINIITTLEGPAQNLQEDVLAFLNLSTDVSKDTKIFGRAAQDIFFSRAAGNNTTQPSSELIQLMQNYGFDPANKTAERIFNETLERLTQTLYPQGFESNLAKPTISFTLDPNEKSTEYTIDALLNGTGSKIVRANYTVLQNNQTIHEGQLAVADGKIDTKAENFTSSFRSRALNEGPFQVHLQVEDEVGNTNETTLTYNLDRPEPTLDIDMQLAPDFSNLNLHMSAEAADLNITDVRYSIELEGEIFREGQLLPVDGRFDNIFEVINTTFPAGHLRNGNYTLNLFVSDQLGQQKNVSMDFAIARNSPQIFINSYYEKEKITLDVLLEGQGSKIVYAKYAFLEEDAELRPMPLAEGNSGLDSTSERFTIEFDPDDLDHDKTYRLYIHTLDEAGNANSTAHTLDLDNYTFTFEDPYKTIREYLYYTGLACCLLAAIAAIPLAKIGVREGRRLYKTVKEQGQTIEDLREEAYEARDKEFGVYQPPQDPEEFYQRLKDRGVPENQINALREKGLETPEDVVAYSQLEKVKIIKETTVSKAKKS